MYPIRPTIDVESADPYEKAKQDIFTAANSVRALPPEQQEKLAKELFQTIDAAMAVRSMQQLLCDRSTN